MKFETRQTVAWCILFTSMIAGPYPLGVHGAVGALATSGTYALVALGMLIGVWATCYPTTTALVTRPAIWNLCVYGGILLTVFLETFGLSGLTIARAAEEYEKPLAFVAAVLCGAASVRFCGMYPRKSLGTPDTHVIMHKDSPRGTPALPLVLTGTFLVGLLRPAAWGALFSSLWGIPLLWGSLLEWALCMVRHQYLRSCIVSLCLGELTWRAISRLGLPLPLSAYTFEDIALAASSICLIGGAAIALRQSKRTGLDALDKNSSEDGSRTTPLEVWERTRLKSAGLTNRELDVLTASLDGLSSLETARHLGLQPSTVRTYRQRICTKLGTDSFDRVLGERSAQAGPFAPVDSTIDSKASLTSTNRADARSVAPAFLRFTGCLSLFVALLMPWGTLPAFWDASWVMAYGCAAGILASCIPDLLHRAGFNHPSDFIRRRVSPIGFCACTLTCLLVRLAMELSGTGFTPARHIALLCAVAGFVSCGLGELRLCVGSRYLTVGACGVACACTGVSVVVIIWTACPWYTATTLALLAWITGTLWFRPGNSETRHGPNAHPIVATSWFAIAFIWEECWRGVVYDSLQDIGCPLLVVLVLLDTATLLRQDTKTRISCVVVLICILLLCFKMNGTFGLLIGSTVLEILVMQTWSATQSPSATNPISSCTPTALLGAAVGSCLAVYIANIRGMHLAQHAASALLATLDWTALGCFAISLAIALGRALFMPWTPAPTIPGINQVRVKGYLIGKGLTDNEVSVCVALARGDSVVQVAEALSYSISAVGTAKQSAFAKLGVKTRGQYMASLWREFGSTQADCS